MSDPPVPRHATIPPELAGSRLDRALARLWPDLSRSRLKQLIETGALTGDRTLAPSDPVRDGESYTLVVPPIGPVTLEPQAIPLTILYEDDALLVIDKPAGLVIHPAPGHADGTLVNAVLAHCGASLTRVGSERRPGIVHRLDKDTSGVMVVAKSDVAHHGLVEQFRVHSIHREYRVFVAGIPSPTADAIDEPIGRHPDDRKRMAVVTRGRTARTHYRVEETFGTGAAQVRCRLETGRTHQIRVHMAYRGHPVLCDPVYGRGTPIRRWALGAAGVAAVNNPKRQALHAAVLGFVHPITGQTHEFAVDLPPDLRLLRNSLIEGALEHAIIQTDI